MGNYFQKTKHLFLNTSTFFNTVKVKNEKSYFQILKFFVIIYIIYQLISAVLLVPAIRMMSQTPAMENLGLLSILGIIFGIIFAFILPFISAILTHIGVLIVGGRQGLFNTFKPVTYALVISVVYNIFSSIASFFLNFIYPIDTNILQKTMFSFHDFPIPHIVLGAVIGISSFIHTIYAEVIGISKFQKMSKLRAFFGVILIPLAIILFIAFLLIVVFGLSFGLLNKFG